MTLAVVRSIGAPPRLETAQEYEDFEQELVDQFLLAGLGAGLADTSIEEDRRAVFEFVRFLGRPVWTAGPEDADRFLTDQRKVRKLGHGTVQRKAWTLAQFFDFLIVRYQGDVHALTGHVLVQRIDDFNRPAKNEYGTPRIPPAEAEVDQLFAGWRESLGQARKFLPAARDYMVARSRSIRSQASAGTSWAAITSTGSSSSTAMVPRTRGSGSFPPEVGGMRSALAWAGA
ncbi:hypothetical protein OHT20_00420 [Streptomyces caniferus]|nr:hypothetical protein [Streptomyces caniferus]